jgi:tRNA A37 threonylcarbamoyladenosine dehydratase
MDAHWLQRSSALFGEAAMEKICAGRVAVLGLGGVGSAAAEALCRSGVGAMLLVDSDIYTLTNLNRQIAATRQTIGQEKAAACAKRMAEINPDGEFLGLKVRLTAGNLDAVFDWGADCIVDAVDTVGVKIALARRAAQTGTPIYMSMGMGWRTDPTMVRCGGFADTLHSGCRLAGAVRRRLTPDEALWAKVVYSLEKPCRRPADGGDGLGHAPASCSFVPPAAGLALAFWAVRDIGAIIC